MFSSVVGPDRMMKFEEGCCHFFSFVLPDRMMKFEEECCHFFSFVLNIAHDLFLVFGLVIFHLQVNAAVLWLVWLGLGSLVQFLGLSFVSRLENITDQLARVCDFSLPKYVIPVSVWCGNWFGFIILGKACTPDFIHRYSTTVYKGAGL